MSFEPLDYVRHILGEVEYLVHASAGVDESTFFADATLQWAFIRSLEVIGEATKRLPPEFRAAHPEVDWRGMAGMRDRLTIRPTVVRCGPMPGELLVGRVGLEPTTRSLWLSPESIWADSERPGRLLGARVVWRGEPEAR